MPTLLIVHHMPSPALQAMFEAVASGAQTDEIEGVEVMVRPALTAAAAEVPAADGYLLGTPGPLKYLMISPARNSTSRLLCLVMNSRARSGVHVCPAPSGESAGTRSPRCIPMSITTLIRADCLARGAQGALACHQCAAPGSSARRSHRLVAKGPDRLAAGGM